MTDENHQRETVERGCKSRLRRQREAKKQWVRRKAWAWSMDKDVEGLCWQILVRERSRIRSERCRPVKALYTGKEFIQIMRNMMGEPERKKWRRKKIIYGLLVILLFAVLLAQDYVEGTTVVPWLGSVMLTGFVTLKSGHWLMCRFGNEMPTWAMAWGNQALIFAGMYAGSGLWHLVDKAMFGG